MIIEKFKGLDNISLYIFFMYILCLPVAKITAVQNILFGLFVLVFTYFNYKRFDYTEFFKIKTFFILFGLLFFLALCSSFYTINLKETLSEIRSEFIKPFIYLIFIYFLINLSDKDRMRKLFFLLGCVLLFHTILNIIIWIDNGGWPSRTGGLLDGPIKAFNIIIGGGERFGIWVTYALSFALSLTFTKYKRYSYLFVMLAVISIIANNTRATFVGGIAIFLFYFMFFYKNRVIKFFTVLIIIISILIFSFYSKNLEQRYNLYNIFSSLKCFTDYTPSQFKILVDNHNIGHSTGARFSMWKSVILYRINEPFIPQSYGRFLYGKAIIEINKDKNENIPYVVFSQAHSDFMSILFSLGIFGLIFFILLLGYTLKVSYTLTKNNNYKTFGIFVFLGTLGYIGSMMFGSFFGDTEQLFFYILLGGTLAIYIKHRNENDKNEKLKTN